MLIISFTSSNSVLFIDYEFEVEYYICISLSIIVFLQSFFCIFSPSYTYIYELLTLR
jgi:hypothetical protein